MFLNIKPQFAAIFLSVAALSMQIEAAPSRVEARRNQAASYTSASGHKKDDTLDALRKLSTQIREMQDQIGHLKAAQNSLSSDSMVKNLSPKVRKMEMQVEYLEKKVRDLPAYADFKKLLSDYDHLKGQLEHVQAQDSSNDEALSTISPVINRMQKQIVYLYQKYKAQEGESYSQLEDKCSQLHKEMESILTTVKERQKVLAQKLVQLQDEKIQKANEALTPKFDLLKKQMKALYSKSKKLESEYSEQEKSVAFVKEELGKKHKIMCAFYTQVKDLKTKTQALSDSLSQGLGDLNVKMSALQGTMQRFENFDTSYIDNKISRMSQQIGILYKNYKQLNQVDKRVSEVLEKQVQADEKLASIESIKASMEGLQRDLANSPESLNNKLTEMESKYMGLINAKADDALISQKINLLQEQINGLHKGFKEVSTSLPKASSLNTVVGFAEMQKQVAELKEKLSERLSVLEQQTDSNLSAVNKESVESAERLNKQIADLYQSYKEMNTTLQSLANVYTQDTQKSALIEALSREVADLKGELLQSQNAIRSVKDLDEKITQLQRQNAFLYSKLTSGNEKGEGASNAEDNAHLMQKLSELSEKVENLSTPNNQSELSSRNLEEELKKRDDEISKLKRRVMYLYSKSRESLDNSAASDALTDKFNVMREELETKILQQLNGAKKDQQIIHGLLEKVASLEEALKTQEETKDSSVTQGEFKG